MASGATEKWIRFFSKAGIPSRAAATYAITFADNRIQMDMLLDLNKEYLRDMGITLMGDVIAILRHARQVHEELTHEKLLSSSKSNCATVSDRPLAINKESTSSSQYSKKVTNLAMTSASSKSVSSSSFNSSSRSPSVSPPSPPTKFPRKSIVSTVQTTAVKNLSSATLSIGHSSVIAEKSSSKRLGANHDTHKRKAIEIGQGDSVKEVLVVNKEALAPPKKVRRVLPEHEGGYKIKMPAGTTPRSQEILAKQKELVIKKTVFDRLGRSSPVPDNVIAAVSSTTSDPVFAVTGLSAEATKKKKVSSVFSRLGDKQVSSTSTAVTRDEPVSYAASSSMVADSLSQPLRNEVQKRIGSSTQSVKLKIPVPQSVQLKIPANPSVKLKIPVTQSSRPKMPVTQSVRPKLPTTSVTPKNQTATNSAGILAKHTVTYMKSVKARLGGPESQSGDIKASLSKRPTTIATGHSVHAKEKIEFAPSNGSSARLTSKRVTFSNPVAPVTGRTGVFSRLGR